MTGELAVRPRSIIRNKEQILMTQQHGYSKTSPSQRSQRRKSAYSSSRSNLACKARSTAQETRPAAASVGVGTDGELDAHVWRKSSSCSLSRFLLCVNYISIKLIKGKQGGCNPSGEAVARRGPRQTFGLLVLSCP